MASQTDEDRRKLLKPKVSTNHVLSILNEFYTEDQTAEVIRELDSYDDVNYLVKIDGEKALLKIHNGVESEAYLRARSAKRAKLNDGETVSEHGGIIDLHTAIFEHLAKPDYNVTTCRTIPVKRSRCNDDRNNSVCSKELPVRLSPDFVQFEVHKLPIPFLCLFLGCKFRSQSSTLGH